MTQPDATASPTVSAQRRPSGWLLPAWLWIVLGGLLLAAAVAVVYVPALRDPFVFDDSVTIFDNDSIQRLWPLVGDDSQRGPLNPPANTPVYGRPLVNVSLAVNYYFGQFDPVGYRLVHLVVHTLAALLLWRIVTRTLRLDYFAGRFSDVAEPLGFAAALVWALHPVDTESVVYVTQRTELLMGLFYLATCYAALRYWDAERTGRGPPGGRRRRRPVCRARYARK